MRLPFRICLVFVVIISINLAARYPLSSWLADPWPSVISLCIALIVCAILDSAVTRRVGAIRGTTAPHTRGEHRIGFSIVGGAAVALASVGLFIGAIGVVQLAGAAAQSVDATADVQHNRSPAESGQLAALEDEMLLRGKLTISDVSDPMSETIRTLSLLRKELAGDPWINQQLPVRPGKGQEAWFGLSTEVRRVAPMNWIVGPPFGDVVVFRSKPESNTGQAYGWIVNPETRRVWAVGIESD